MKLFYYKARNGNFGDDLNAWLWQQLIPDLFDDDESTAFFGIGTVINDRLYERVPEAKKIVVFGSGVGYGKQHLTNLPKVDDSWKIYCLRGPLSAQALGVSPELAVTDGALLIRRLYKATGNKTSRFAYMPHVDQAERGGKAWKSVCDQLGFGYIDPRWSREEVLSSISQTEVLLTEAMHGAIVADALRVPWVPIQTNSTKILGFKWWDWCLSVGVEYQPRNLVELTDPKGIRSSIRHWRKRKTAVEEFSRMTKSLKPTLSDDTRIERLTVALEEKLQHLKNDVAARYFCSST